MFSFYLVNKNNQVGIVRYKIIARKSNKQKVLLNDGSTSCQISMMSQKKQHSLQHMPPELGLVYSTTNEQYSVGKWQRWRHQRKITCRPMSYPLPYQWTSWMVRYSSTSHFWLLAWTSKKLSSRIQKSIFNEETCFLPVVGKENAAICAIKIKAMQIVKYCMFLITN